MIDIKSIVKWFTLKRFVLWFLVFPAVPPVIAAIGILGYANWPRAIDEIQLPPINSGTQNIVVVFHGKDDVADTWATEIADTLATIDMLQEGADAIQTFAVSWRPYSNNALRCSVDGMEIGQTLGRKLAQNSTIKNVHLIAHSAGAFVIYGFCKALKHANTKLNIRTTYLDPLGIYGGLQWNYGLQNFGDCADYSEAFINVGDGVPGSEVALTHMPTFDVSNAPGSSEFELNPHIWPVYYYLNKIKNAIPSFPFKNSETFPTSFPSGQLIRIN